VEDKFKLTPEENVFLAKKNLVSNIYTEAKIEDLNITFPQTEAILNGGNVPSLPLDTINTILNLRDAWHYVFDHLNDSVTLDYIKQINFWVSRNQSLKWGELRNGKVGIAGTDHQPLVPDPETTEQQITTITGQELSATELALNLDLYLCYNQLFWDGNKRTAHIAANAWLIQNGCGVLAVPENQIAQYHALLRYFYQTGDGEMFKKFLYQKCLFGLE
jgi:prophage maintenance system killer protein